MKLSRRQFLHLAAGAAALPAVSRPAKAQAYPARTVRLIVPVPPGGKHWYAVRRVGFPDPETFATAYGSLTSFLDGLLSERGIGFETPAARVPLVGAAVVYDLGLGDPSARPDADEGYAACDAAAGSFDRGTVGAGTGCTVGKLLGAEHWTKGGLGHATVALVGGGTIAAIAVVNAVGDVVEIPGLRATVLRVDDQGGPMAVHYEFYRDLDSPEVAWLSEGRSGFADVDPRPPVGIGVRLAP